VTATPLPLNKIPTDATYFDVKVAVLDDSGDAELVVFTCWRWLAALLAHRFVREEWQAQPKRLYVGKLAWWQVRFDPDSDEDGMWRARDCAPAAPGAVPVITVGVDY
jgi:hypothetical protein